MSALLEPTTGLLFTSIIYHEDYFSQDELIKIWSTNYGTGKLLKTDFNPSLAYYAKEMGLESKLHRFIYCSLKPYQRSELVSTKLWATNFENEHSENGKRVVNIDVGLLNLENMILATGKNYSHRVYLADGVFADINYQYQAGSYTFFPWTYPDYQEEAKRVFFQEMRQQLLKMHKEL